MSDLVRYEPRRLSDIRVIGSPRPFATDRIDLEFPAGKTVAQILRDTGLYPYPGTWAYVTVGDCILPQEWWEYARPKAGHVITVRIIPSGRGAKQIFGAILTVILTIIGYGLGGLVGGALFGAGTGATIGGAVGAVVGGLVSRLIVGAITPPPRTKLPQTNGIDPTVQSITGTQNSINKYGPIAKVFGKPPPFYPCLGAEPYTEIAGNDQFLRMLFVVGYGPLSLDIADMKIGETPLSHFADVEIEIRAGWSNDPPLTLYSNDFKEDRFSIKLVRPTQDETYWVERLTPPGIDEISIDLILPRGLCSFNAKGEKVMGRVLVVFQYALINTDNWYSFTYQIPGTSEGFLEITDILTSEVRRNFRVVVPHGQYRVRGMRISPDSPTDSKNFDEVYWTVLRSVTYIDPIDFPGLAKIALRIRASDQLNGVIDKFSVIAQAILPTWDGSQWIVQATRNHAWAWTEVLRSFYGGNKRAIADDRLDLQTIKQWADKNDAEGRTFNAVIDSRATVSQLLQDIPASARARRSWNEGKYSVVWDRVQTVAVNHFTPKNSWDYKGAKIFGDQPHGVKVRFRNSAATVPDVSADEWIVLDDGYSWDYADDRGRVDAFGNASNLPLASKFEVIDLLGITNKDFAWKDGRYHIAAGRLRPEIHEITVDVENLRCTVGDLVRLSHDASLFGLMWGRIKEVALDGSGNCTGVTLDELVVMEAGKTYSLRIRTPEGELYPTIVTIAGETDTLTFSVAITGAIKPHQGDLFAFGESGLESADMIVKEIIPARDLSAKLLLIDYAPAIYQADIGTIPPFNSKVTRPAELISQPEKPIISQVLSDESVLIINADGSQSSRILVTFDYPSSPAQNIFFQGRIRRSITGASWQLFPLMPSDTREISFAPVDDGLAYDVAIRAIQQSSSLASEWAQVTNHVVIGKIAKPPDVTTFLLEGDSLTWLYPNPPRDLGGFLLRRHLGNNRHWGSALPMHSGVWRESPFSIGNLANGLQTFLIKAVDSVGNESENAAIIVKDLGDPIFQNIVLEDDHREQGWPATITNGQVIAGDLVARPISSLFWTNDANLFWTDDAASFWHGTFWTDDVAPFWNGDALPFWGEMFATLIYEAEIIPDYLDIGTRMLLDIDAAGGTYKAEYATGSDAPFWNQNEELSFWDNDAALFWTAEPEFQLWPGQINVKHERYRIRITVPSGLEGRLVQFTILIDAQDIEEFLNDIAIAVGGTHLPLTKSYREIKSITYGLQDDGGGAVTVKTLDKPSALVGCFDSSEAPTAGLIDAFVKGF